MVRYRQDGLLPIAGGVLDQAACYMRASELVRGMERYWKTKLDPMGVGKT